MFSERGGLDAEGRQAIGLAVLTIGGLLRVRRYLLAIDDVAAIESLLVVAGAGSLLGAALCFRRGVRGWDALLAGALVLVGLTVVVEVLPTFDLRHSVRLPVVLVVSVILALVGVGVRRE